MIPTFFYMFSAVQKSYNVICLERDISVQCYQFIQNETVTYENIISLYKDTIIKHI
jgi:hypothetical protein